MRLINEIDIQKSLSRIRVHLLLIQHEADLIRLEMKVNMSVFSGKSSLPEFVQSSLIFRFFQIRRAYVATLDWKQKVEQKIEML